MYEAHEEEEPPYQYVPDIIGGASSGPAGSLVGGNALAQSMLLLEDGLASGALLAQFEQLYRKNPQLTANEARKPENQVKNRYRDISPCKCGLILLH